MSHPDTLRRVVAQLGGPAAVARHCGVRGQAVSQWIVKGRVPAERVPLVVGLARQLGQAVRAEELRPDVAWREVCEACS